jgi:hypothetical protein
MPDMTGRCHRHPRMPGGRYLSTRIHHITAWYIYSTNKTRINDMITLAQDRHALAKADFFT